MYGVGVLVIGAILSALTFLLAKFFKEAAQILADIGDATAEANSRTQAAGAEVSIIGAALEWFMRAAGTILRSWRNYLLCNCGS